MQILAQFKQFTTSYKAGHRKSGKENGNQKR